MAAPAQTNPLRQTYLQEATKEAKAQLLNTAKESHMPAEEEDFESYFALAMFAYQAESNTNISLSEVSQIFPYFPDRTSRVIS